MNRSQSFNALIDLVKLDTFIQSQQEVLEKLFHDEKNLIIQQQSLEKSVAELKHAVVLAKKRVDTVELVMKELDDQEKNKKRNIDQLTGYKEYKSLQIEINNLHEDQRNQEQTVIDAWSAFDLAEGRYMQQLPLMQEKIEKVCSEIALCREKQLLLQKEIVMQQEERPAKQHIVPHEWMEKYILMQSRVKNPVVPVEFGSCTACFYQLTPTDMQLTKKGSLVQCKSCFRLLYVPDVMQVG